MLPTCRMPLHGRKEANARFGNLTATCYIHGPNIPENTGFSDYAIPFREVNQCIDRFGPVRINSPSSPLFHSFPQPKSAFV
jgi:hypothetical protein